MLGDPTKLMNNMRSPATLARAYDFAVRCRRKNDYFYDYFDLDDRENSKQKVVEELVVELQSPATYIQRIGYAYYPPKTELCSRRMVYIPLKDLTARFAATIVISDLLDDQLSERAFANRRAKPTSTRADFLESFADKSWPAFANWQGTERHNYPVLLKTDISAFYDSVSHEYIANALARELHVPTSCEFMQIVKRLLRIPVISYDFVTGKAKPTDHNEQGLAIGNSTEGVLANMFLKDIDEQMGGIDKISFGRYADDIRIFADTRERAKHAMLVLQQLLLTRGLNLNSAKTEIAETDAEFEELVSKAYEGYDYGAEVEEEDAPAGAAGPHATVVDQPFSTFSITFDVPLDLANLPDGKKPEKIAKQFCLFMGRASGQNALLPIASRQAEHMDVLVQILKRYQTATKHAAWLLAQTCVHEDVPADVVQYARAKLIEVLQSSETSSYGKYRLLHHFVKERSAPSSRYLERLDGATIAKLEACSWVLLTQPAFELNIAAMKLLHVRGSTYDDLFAVFKKQGKIPLALPIQRALEAIKRIDGGTAAGEAIPQPGGAGGDTDEEDEGADYG